MTLKGKINSIKRHPTILKDILQAKNAEEIRDKIKRLDQRRTKMQDEKEVHNFISYLKKGNNYSIDTNNERALNRLCCIEDWENSEFKRIIYELQNASLASYVHRKDWTIPTDNKIISMRKPGFIHRKDWEWALGIIAMRRFDKLNKNNVAIGIGVGREEVMFYLANELKHVYATDIYDGKQWENFAPVDFPENPRKYAPFPYKEDTLTVLRMDGTKIEFPSETFDIAFSFSSIEHFDGEKNHEGAVKSMREIERILKKEGIAVIATEYIINDKDHPEFFNKKTIYSDLIDKLDLLKLVEPLDLRITTKTLDTVMDYSDAVYWDISNDDGFKKSHPLVLIRVGNMLLTSVMLVFEKLA